MVTGAGGCAESLWNCALARRCVVVEEGVVDHAEDLAEGASQTRMRNPYKSHTCSWEWCHGPRRGEPEQGFRAR